MNILLQIHVRNFILQLRSTNSPVNILAAGFERIIF